MSNVPHGPAQAAQAEQAEERQAPQHITGIGTFALPGLKPDRTG